MMKSKIFCWLIAGILFLGCDRESTTDPSLTFTGDSGCKQHGLNAEGDASRSQDCIQYAWQSGDTLVIKHVNAGFNCCPEGFRVDLLVAGDTLVITETENSNLCDCNCLFDLDYYLTGISRGKWWIRVNEQYARQPDDEKILFKADFKEMADGEFCVTRTNYPWGY